MRRGDFRESLATRDRLRLDTLDDDGQRAGKGVSSGKKGKQNEVRGGGRGEEKRTNEKGVYYGERERERARLSVDAADSTTGGGGLTAPLHIHPRYIDLSRPPPSSRLASLLATLLSPVLARIRNAV